MITWHSTWKWKWTWTWKLMDKEADKEADHLLANGVATTGGPAAAQVKCVASYS
jgi:hypothetical protein